MVKAISELGQYGLGNVKVCRLIDSQKKNDVIFFFFKSATRWTTFRPIKTFTTLCNKIGLRDWLFY